MPRSSASRFLVSPKTRSASACRPHRYRAIISSPVACSRSGCVGRQRGQLGHRRGRLPPGEQQLGPLLDRGGAQLGQPPLLGLGERAGHPGVGQAPPQRQRLVHRPQRAVKVAVRAQPAGRGQAALEVLRVEAAGAEPQQVAAAAGDERPGRRPARPVRVAARPVRLDNAAQPRHVGVDAALGAGRRLVSPDRVDQLAARDHPVGTGGEHPEHRQLPRLTCGLLPAVAPDRHRPEHSYPQRNHRKPPLSRRVRPRARGHAELRRRNQLAQLRRLPDSTAGI